MISADAFNFPAGVITQLPKHLTFTYKCLPHISLKADVYIHDSSPPCSPSPILLYLHGGGWIYGSRVDIPTLYFQEILCRNFVIVSADYRLLPESDFLPGQMEDVRDIEVWLRDALPRIMSEHHKKEVDPEKIVVRSTPHSRTCGVHFFSWPSSHRPYCCYCSQYYISSWCQAFM
jgi:acetyl esterase/lipase